MKSKLTLFVSLFVFILTGCNSDKVTKTVTLTFEEKRICDSLRIDTNLVRALKKSKIISIEPFHYSLSKMYENGKETELDPIHLDGIVFNVNNRDVEAMITEFYADFKNKGYTLFVVEQNFNINNKPDLLGLLKTTDKYEILDKMETDATNYGVDNDSIIKVIREFDAKYSLELIGAGGDWCQFIINNTPKDWNAIASEAYTFCPYIVDQGTGTVEELAKEMQKSKRLYFWWD